MESRVNPPTEEIKKPKHKNTWIYIIIIALLLATNIFLFLRKENQNQLAASRQLLKTISEKEALQNEYVAALARLDILKSKNATLQEKLDLRDSSLQSLKSRINIILSNANASKPKLNEARALINDLKRKITEYKVEIEKLREQNSNLIVQRDSVVSQNSHLRKKIKIAKKLHASNIKLIPINLRKGGRRETETEKARKVDLLRISFDIDQNLLIESGPKEFDIRIVNPTGLLLSNAALGSGSFIDIRGTTQYFSVSKVVKLSSGIPLKNIYVDWRQAASYDKGPYIVEIYCQGQLIGQGTAILR